MTSPLSPRTAPTIALLAAAAFGLSTPLAKLLLAGVEPVALASLLYLGSGLGLGAIYLFRVSRSKAEPLPTRSDLPWLIGTIVLGGITGPVFLMLGLVRTDAASASLLLNLEAVFTLLVAWLVFREHVDRRLFAGAMAIVGGALLLSWQGGWGSGGAGVGLVVLACACWAVDNNLTRKISAADPFAIAALKGLAAGSVNAFAAWKLGAAVPPVALIVGAMTLGFFSYGLGLVLFILALRHLGTARTGAYYGTAPFIGALAAAIVIGEPLLPMQIVAGLLMAFGAWLHLTERHSHEHLHAELDHTHLHVHDAHHQHSHDPDDPNSEPHTHPHRHEPLRHVHAHWPDTHHWHKHQ